MCFCFCFRSCRLVIFRCLVPCCSSRFFLRSLSVSRIWSCCGRVALSHVLISSFVLRQPLQNPVVSSMEQMEMQGETMPVFLPMGVSDVGVGEREGDVVMGVGNHKTVEFARGLCLLEGSKGCADWGSVEECFCLLRSRSCFLMAHARATDTGFWGLTGVKHRVRWRTRGGVGGRSSPAKARRERARQRLLRA